MKVLGMEEVLGILYITVKREIVQVLLIRNILFILQRKTLAPQTDYCLD